MSVSDYILNEDGDLKIENGDFVFGDGTIDNQRLLLLAEKGEWKQAPLASVGLRSYLDDDNIQELLREVRRRFTQDGMTVKSLNYDGKKLIFDASYGRV